MSTLINYKNICGHSTTINAESCNGETIISIDSTCKTVMELMDKSFVIKLDEMIKPIFNIQKMVEICNNNTPTCFLPTMIMNAVWIENGLLSKNLAKKTNLISINKIE